MLRSSTRGSAGWGTGDSPLPFRSPLEREFSRVVVTRSCLRSCIWQEGINVRFCQPLMGFASFSAAGRSWQTSVCLFSSWGRWIAPRAICSGHCRHKGLYACRVCPLASSPRRSCLGIPPVTQDSPVAAACSSRLGHARGFARPDARPSTRPRSDLALRRHGSIRRSVPAKGGVAQGCSYCDCSPRVPGRELSGTPAYRTLSSLNISHARKSRDESRLMVAVGQATSGGASHSSNYSQSIAWIPTRICWPFTSRLVSAIYRLIPVDFGKRPLAF